MNSGSRPPGPIKTAAEILALFDRALQCAHAAASDPSSPEAMSESCRARVEALDHARAWGWDWQQQDGGPFVELPATAPDSHALAAGRTAFATFAWEVHSRAFAITCNWSSETNIVPLAYFERTLLGPTATPGHADDGARQTFAALVAAKVGDVIRHAVRDAGWQYYERIA